MQTSRPALFLDRDGCVIEEVDYLSRLEDLQLIPAVAEALKKAQQAGYLLILVTNQSGVAKGKFTEDFVHQAHERLQEMIKEAGGAMLDGIYYCPHRKDGQAPYNIDCDCRKPKRGMLDQAAADYKIDWEQSYMIGDKICDVAMGFAAGMTGVLVRTGHGEQEIAGVLEAYPHTPVYEDLAAAIEEIIKA